MYAINPEFPIASTFQPKPWQVPVWNCKDPVMLLTGSAGGGKSYIASEKLHGLAMAYPGVSCLIVRRVQASMKNTVLTPLERRVMGEGHGIEHEKGAKRYMYPNGSAVFYLGVKDDESLERLKGIGLEGGIEFLWIEEANELRTRDAFSALLARMRGIFSPWTQVILTCNPDSDQHWIYQDLILGKQATVFYSSIDDNDSSPEIYRRNLSQMTGIQAERMREGRWVHATGGIYPEYKAELHVVPNALMDDPRSRINHTWTVEAGVDWGFAHAGVISVWAFDDYDRAFLIYECVRRQQTIDFWVTEAKYLQQRFRIKTFYCGPDKPDNILKFKQAGLNAVKAKNSFYAGRDEVKRRLKPDINGVPLLFICAGATDKDDEMVKNKIPCGLGEEITGYVYEKAKQGEPNEEPLKKNDDSCDAARYALYSHSWKPSRDTFRASDIPSASVIVDPATELRRLTQTMQGHRLIQKQF